METTPGPWHLSKGKNEASIYTEATIATVPDDLSQWEANAQAITAIPELIKACEWAAQSFHHPSCPVAKGKSFRCECHVGACQAAIRKTTGEDLEAGT
jgi:hypothetical protein